MRRSLLAMLVAGGAALCAQQLPPGPHVVAFQSAVDGSEQPYALYVPRNLDRDRKCPLVISLHGENSNHLVSLRQVLGRSTRPGETLAEASRFFPPLPDVPFLVAAPLARGTMGYRGIAEKDVYDVLADVKRRFAVDEDRVYLTGVSMGGGGALRLALTRPDVWAAVVAVCPRVPDGLDALLANGSNVPMQIYQGEMDPLVSAQGLREFQKKLLDAGVNVEYIEYPRVRHNAWDNAYSNARVFEWFTRYKRSRFPQRVSFTTRHYSYPGAWWVRLDRFTPGTAASLDASFTGANQLTVVTAGLDAFTLHAGEHPGIRAGQLVRLQINGVPLSVKAASDLSFHRAGKTWRAGLSRPAPGEKRPGAEGPIPAAIAVRHVYVYGTADNPGDAERKRRQDIAAQAAAWSTPANHLTVSFPVAADRDVSLSDEKSANLILFGTRETNSLVARAALRLPLVLSTSAADYGLVYIVPDAGRYLVINSGLPWWTGADQVRRAAPVNLRPPYPPWRVLETFSDFLVFKGSLEHVVSEGRFQNDWSIPAAAAATIKATGAVQIR